MYDRLGLKVALADIDEPRLIEAGQKCAEIVGASNVLVVPTDVSKLEQVTQLRDRVYEAWGEVRSLRLFIVKLHPSMSYSDGPVLEPPTPTVIGTEGTLFLALYSTHFLKLLFPSMRSFIHD